MTAKFYWKWDFWELKNSKEEEKLRVGVASSGEELNLAPNLGLGFGLGSLLCFCFPLASLISPSLGTVVQKAFRHPVTILKTPWTQLNGMILYLYLRFGYSEKKHRWRIWFMKKIRTGSLLSTVRVCAIAFFWRSLQHRSSRCWLLAAKIFELLSPLAAIVCMKSPCHSHPI